MGYCTCQRVRGVSGARGDALRMMRRGGATMGAMIRRCARCADAPGSPFGWCSARWTTGAARPLAEVVRENWREDWQQTGKIGDS